MSEINNHNRPAFPCQIPRDNGYEIYYCTGLTMRDWFAGQALAGLLANSAALERGFTVDGSKQLPMPELAYYTADAMLAAREKGMTNE